MAELLAADQITIAKVLDGENGADGEMSAEQLAMLNQASTDASTALSNSNTALSNSSTALSTATAAKAGIDGIEIGGRNLFLDSENMKPSTYSGSTITHEEGITVSEWSTTEARRAYGTGGTSKLVALFQQTKFPQDGTYTSSIYIKNNHTTNSLVLGRYITVATLAPGEVARVTELYNYTTKHVMQIQVKTVAVGDEFDFTYWRPKMEQGNKATDWTPAYEDIYDSIDTVQGNLDTLDSSVFGVDTYEYLLDGVAVPVYKKDDGTYYYILNDSEVTIDDESLLVHEGDELKVYRSGGLDDILGGAIDDLSGSVDELIEHVNSFDTLDADLTAKINANSLIARGNARVESNSVIITNETATDTESLKNYLQINADSIIIYGNGKPIVTMAKTDSDDGFLKLVGTSLLQAQEAKFSTVRMRSAEGDGNLAFVANSDGHLSIKEVL